MAKSKSVRSSAIAEFLKASLHGKDLDIRHVAPIEALTRNGLTFARRFDEKKIALVNAVPQSLVICGPEYKGRLKASHILSEHPGYDFVRTVAAFFWQKPAVVISTSAAIDPAAKIGKHVSVGRNSVIGPEVSIGDDTTVGDNVVITGKTKIGKRCVIKANAVIGEAGFGFELSATGVPHHFPHLGGIEIGDDVWIGAGTCIERAHITKTIIKNNVKIDDLVQIGHNCVVSENAIVTSGTVLCGAVKVGRNAWIAPNSSVKEKCKIGADAVVGLGSVVIRDVAAKTVVAGNPARILKKK
jgi:UDP-3-O-[3-hydroxymyristoyl] glucosamine N-acyltransferase LpxD